VPGGAEAVQALIAAAPSTVPGLAEALKGFPPVTGKIRNTLQALMPMDAPPFLDRIMRITGIHHLFARQEDQRPAGEEAASTEQRPSPSL